MMAMGSVKKKPKNKVFFGYLFLFFGYFQHPILNGYEMADSQSDQPMNSL